MSYHNFHSKQFPITDNRRFYIYGYEHNTRFEVHQRGRYTPEGEPYVVESELTWKQAVELLDKLNSNSN